MFNNNINFSNNAGYKKVLSTLSIVVPEILKQRFFTIKNIPDYVDIKEGIGGVAEEVFKWAEFSVAGDFENGATGSNIDMERTASADVVYGNIIFQRQRWRKMISWNWWDLQTSSIAKIENLIEGKMTALRKNWDLGIQDIIFNGSKANAGLKGLLNQDNVAVNTTAITKPLSLMSASEFNSFIATLPNLFYDNSNNTIMFNRFIIPADDYNGLVSQMSETFPLKTKLEVLEEAFGKLVAGYGISDFKVLPLVYANANKTATGQPMYILYNKDSDTLFYDLPLDFQVLGQATPDNYNIVNYSVGMYGGVQVQRPKEMLYFTFA